MLPNMAALGAGDDYGGDRGATNDHGVRIVLYWNKRLAYDLELGATASRARMRGTLSL